MLGEVVLLLAASAVAVVPPPVADPLAAQEVPLSEAVAVVPPPVADPLAAQEVPLSEAGYGAQDFERKNGDMGNIPKQIIWNSPAERARFRAKLPCEGECISKKKAEKKCNGIVDKSFKCSGKKKVCCLPDNTTPSVPLTCPEVTCPPCRTETHYTEESFPWYWTDPTSETPWWTYNSDSTEMPSSVFPTKRCPEGFFQIFHTRHPSPCYKFYDDIERSYSDAKGKCQAEGLALPEPVNPIGLRKYLAETYVVGSRTHAHVWLGARSTGLYFKWERSGRQISNSDSLWAPPYPGSLISSSYCLDLLASKSYWLTYYPNKPYASQPCYNMRYTLCEYVMN